MDQFILIFTTLIVQIVILTFQLVGNSKISKNLEKFKQEIMITNTTYSKFIEIILEYYNNIYKFYQICLNVANYTTVEYRDGSRKFYVEIYANEIDNFLNVYNETRGTVRLLLPNNVFKLDEELLDAFNNFRNVIDLKSENYKILNNTPESKKKILEVFKPLHNAKENLENGLREVLRIESLLFSKNVIS